MSTRARILFVEDEPAIAEPFSRALARNGFDVITALTAAQALERFEAHPARPCAPRPRATGRRRPRRVPRPAPHVGGPDHHAHRPRHRDGPRRGPRDRRGRLRGQAVLAVPRSSRASGLCCAGRRLGDAPPAAYALGDLRIDAAARRAWRTGNGARPVAQGVRPAARARAPARARRSPRGAHGPTSGTATGSARPRRSTCTSDGCAGSSATTLPPRATCTRSGASATASSPPRSSSDRSQAAWRRRRKPSRAHRPHAGVRPRARPRRDRRSARPEPAGPRRGRGARPGALAGGRRRGDRLGPTAPVGIGATGRPARRERLDRARPGPRRGRARARPCRQRGRERGDSYRGRPEIAAALRGRSVQETRRSATLGADILATAVPIRRGPGPPAGAVRITQSVSAVHRGRTSGGRRARRDRPARPRPRSRGGHADRRPDRAADPSARQRGPPRRAR